MSDKEIKSIADPNAPNAGRIYDYWLGGHHHFEVDRKMGDQIIEIAPFMPHTARMIRWFLAEAVRNVVERGFDHFIDFASGLPTKDHIHLLTPEGAKVIYSDIDPITVEYGLEIIGQNANVKYVTCDAGRPEELLTSDVLRDLFGDNRHVAIGMNGIAWFLSDEQLSHALHILYEWADEGSVIFTSDANADPSSTNDLTEFADLYQSIGQPIYPRQQKVFLEMVKPWKISAPGALPFDEWLDIGKEVKDQQVETWGGQGFYGVILEK